MCIRDSSCTKHASLNAEGSRTAALCKKHAKDEMPSTYITRCLQATCANNAYSNVEVSKKAVYCKQHACDHMVDVLSKSCSHDDCTKKPSFNVESTKTAAFCKQHAQDGMINVRTTRSLTHPRQGSAWTGCAKQRCDIRKRHG